MSTERTYGGLTAAQLAALDKAATPGPWTAGRERDFAVKPDGTLVISDEPTGSAIVRRCYVMEDGRRATQFPAYCNGGGCPNEANAALLAAARNALPEMLAHIAELERMLKENGIYKILTLRNEQNAKQAEHIAKLEAQLVNANNVITMQDKQLEDNAQWAEHLQRTYNDACKTINQQCEQLAKANALAVSHADYLRAIIRLFFTDGNEPEQDEVLARLAEARKDAARLDRVVREQWVVQDHGSLVVVRDWSQRIIGEDIDFRAAIDAAMDTQARREQLRERLEEVRKIASEGK